MLNIRHVPKSASGLFYMIEKPTPLENVTESHLMNKETKI